MDRTELKNQALLERISELENRVADLRVEVTVLSQDNQGLQSEVQRLNGELATQEENSASQPDHTGD